MIGFGSYLDDFLKYEGISQTEFAFKLGITQKHLNEIIHGKTELSVDLMVAIASLTGIDFNFIVEVENKRKMVEKLKRDFKNEESLIEYLNKYNPKELEKKKWVILKDKSNPYQIANDILHFLKYRNFDIVNLLKKKILFKENGNRIELLSLWLARCESIAEEQRVGEYTKENISLAVNDINEYLFDRNTITKDILKTILNQYGLYFVLEDALPGTKVRGAFKLFKGHPAIFLTTQYKRTDGIIFSLFHELGHVKSDYNQGKSKVIIEGSEEQEKRSDQFALDAMISPKDYKEILKHDMTQQQLEAVSKEKRIPICYIVSRLAKENLLQYHDSLYQNNISGFDLS